MDHGVLPASGRLLEEPRNVRQDLMLTSLFERVMNRGSLFKSNDGTSNDQNQSLSESSRTETSPLASRNVKRSPTTPQRGPVRRLTSVLLEEWPDRPTRREEQRRKKKSVRFADSAFLHLFDKDTKSAKRLSYSKSDRKDFTRFTLMEAVRIKKLLESIPEESRGSVLEQLEMCNVEVEEVIGIELLVLEKSQKKIVKRRRILVQLTMLEQEKQRAAGHNDPNVLAETSIYISEKSILQARRRAQFAAI